MIHAGCPSTPLPGSRIFSFSTRRSVCPSYSMPSPFWSTITFPGSMLCALTIRSKQFAPVRLGSAQK